LNESLILEDRLETLRRLAEEPLFSHHRIAAQQAREAIRRSGENDSTFWLTLDSLALGLEKDDNLHELEILLVWSLELRQRNMGVGHLTNAALLEKLAAFNCRLGRFDKAQYYAQSILSIIDGQLNPQSYDVLKALYALALICHAQGEYAQAESLYTRVIKNLVRQDKSFELKLNDVLKMYAQLLETTQRLSEAQYLTALASLDTPDVDKIIEAIERLTSRRTKQPIGSPTI
jgi:tetratricopeptide (TPR) repeat protein